LTATLARAGRESILGWWILAPFQAARVVHHRVSTSQENMMSKGQDQKREQKKKPAKTLDEKRAAKKAKKAGR
jgi:hypothetical protein